MKRHIIILLAILAASIGMAAQNPIRWRMSVKMHDAVSGTVTIRALIDEGWHMYGTQLPEDGPRPTRFEFALKGVKLDGTLKASRPTVTRQDEIFGMELNWWDSDVTFTQNFTLEHPQDASISMTVNYMGCNDSNCLPPKSETLTYTFK